MKTSRQTAGEYILTGYMAGILCQYSITKNGHLWQIDRICGSGPEFPMGYSTKSEAVQHLKAYAD